MSEAAPDLTATIPAPTGSPVLSFDDEGGGGHDPNSLESVLSELGLEPEAPKDGGNGHANGKAKPAPAAAKGEDDEADPKAKVEAKDDKETPPAEDDEAAVRGILKRARERRTARAAAQRQAAPATAAAAPKPIEAPKVEPPKPTPPPAGVAAAVEDVLKQIAKLAGDDEAADAAAKQGTPDTGKAARTAELVELKKIVEGLGEAIKGDSASLKERVEKAETALQAIDDQRFVRQLITDRLDSIETEIPTLAGRRDAVDLVEIAAQRYFEKYNAKPPIKALARRIEKKLAGSNGTQQRSTTPEKHTPSRKTVSSALGSPPAARSGPDKRSSKEVARDLFASLGVDPDDDAD